MCHGENTSPSLINVVVDYNSREFSDVTVIIAETFPTNSFHFLIPTLGGTMGGLSSLVNEFCVC